MFLCIIRTPLLEVKSAENNCGLYTGKDGTCSKIKVPKVLMIQPDKFEHFLHKFWMWNSKEQLLDINMPRSRTLSEGFMISIFGLAYSDIHYNY